MIVSTLIAASVAAQPVPAQEPEVSPDVPAEKKMACCEKMAKGEGCCCCKGAENDDPDGASPGGNSDSGQID